LIPPLSRIEISGRSIAYRVAGSGPPLILLHGFTQDSRVWRPQLERLADAYTVVAWDAPGAGGSADPDEGFGITAWAGALGAFCDAIGLESTHVAGLSWGGLLAQELYRREPSRVRSLILAGTYAGWTGSLSRMIAKQRLAACIRDSALPPEQFVPRYLPGMFGKDPPREAWEELGSIMSEFHPVGFRLMATALARADTRDLLPSIRVPCLLIWGDEDVRSPSSVADQFAAAIPGAQLVRIERAGHVSNLERADEFSTVLRDFLGSVADPPS
jgi:pimeloyl-ACP methyl ester carboxylesterase